MNLSLYDIYTLIMGIILIAGAVISLKKKLWIFFGISLSIVCLMTPLTNIATPKEGIVGSLAYLAIFLFIHWCQIKKIKRKQKKIREYQQSEYYKQTNNDYEAVTINDKGKYGELLIYDELRPLEGKGARFIFNAYLPKDEDNTSEVDVIVISKSGLFVIESKNYSGWIFGDANRKMWTQTLQSGEKNQFYNPIWQNQSHCKYLASFLNIDDSKIISYIVFSNRCEFKKVPDNTSTYRIIHRKHLPHYVEEDMERRENQFTLEEVNIIFNKLFPLTQVSDDIKQEHINNIKA